MLEGPFGLLAVEIKYSQSVSGRDLKNLSEFVKEHKARWGLVLNNDEAARQYDTNLIGIPVAAL